MKRKKIILWSLFVFSAICLTAVGVDAIFEKKLYVVAYCFIMLSFGFLSTKYLLKKVDKKEKQLGGETRTAIE